MSLEVTTDQACIDKMLRALPFANNDAGLDETAQLIRLLVNERNHMKRALEPFGKMAGELFARNYDAEDVVLMFKTPEDEKIKLDFADFLVVRDALAKTT